MFSKKRLRPKSSLSIRLTAWYAGFFSFFFFLAFLIFYLSMTSVFMKEADKGLLSEINEFMAISSTGDIDTLKTAIRLESESEGKDNVFYRILTPKGDIIDTSDMSLWPQNIPDKNIINQLSPDKNYLYDTLFFDAFPYRARVIYARLNPQTILQFAEKMEEEAEFMKIFKTIFVFSTFLIVVVASLVGWFMSKRALQGVREVINTTKRIGQGEFRHRVQLKNRGDEIEELAITFNDMLEKIQVLMREMKEMSDNIAHDLKSPVTGIRGMAEISLNSYNSIDEYRKMAGKTIEECDRIVNMVNTMLYISETESGAADHHFEEVDLAHIIRGAVELFMPVAEDKKCSIVLDAPDKIMLKGEKQMLQRMVANILDNAFKYSQENGKIEISANIIDEQVDLHFKDRGPGIPEEDLDRIFMRFFRCDKSRSLPGSGLGLSLVKAIVRAHNGTIRACNRKDGGTTISISLPVTQ